MFEVRLLFFLQHTDPPDLLGQEEPLGTDVLCVPLARGSQGLRPRGPDPSHPSVRNPAPLSQAHRALGVTPRGSAA